MAGLLEEDVLETITTKEVVRKIDEKSGVVTVVKEAFVVMAGEMFVVETGLKDELVEDMNVCEVVLILIDGVEDKLLVTELMLVLLVVELEDGAILVALAQALLGISKIQNKITTSG